MTATPPPASLAERIDAAIRPAMLIGLQDAELYDEPGRERIGEWADFITSWVLAVVQPELDRLARENHFQLESLHRCEDDITRLRTELAQRDEVIDRLRAEILAQGDAIVRRRDQTLAEAARLIESACLGGGCGDWGRCTCDANIGVLNAARTPTS
ncbi:hypothetical protein [Kitasatospora sp. NPDC047058]|uniref:hypothetical protein n=1 Tax=Kitasatospora sp. NPDC047058 TaxID=3155620 RepID=UPI0033D9027B